MKALDVMVRDVVTVKPDDTVAEAVRLLAEHDVSALPVVDDEENVVGVISEADLVHREEIGTDKHRPWWLEAVTPASTLAEEFAKSHGRRVDEVMSTDVVSASEDTPLGEIATLSNGTASSACRSCAAASSWASSAGRTSSRRWHRRNRQQAAAPAGTPIAKSVLS